MPPKNLSMENMSKNMRVTGMLLLMDAFRESQYKKSSILSVVHTAQSAEILIKARIADEHPLLIFKKIPEKKAATDYLSLDLLLEKGQTLSYSELPDRLWASAGLTINDLEGWYEFGRLRNQIVHTSLTNRNDLNFISLKFILEILDPLVESFWGKSVIEFIKYHPDRSKDLKYDLMIMSCEGDDLFIHQCDTFPRLRNLIGGKALDDWEEYKKDLQRDIRIHKNQMSELNENHIPTDRDHEIADAINAEYEFRKKEEYRWEKFLDEFKEN
jgi:hypothetical protein